jgi:hypothetical protein
MPAPRLLQPENGRLYTGTGRFGPMDARMLLAEFFRRAHSPAFSESPGRARET